MEELEAQVNEKKAKKSIRKGRLSIVANTFLDSVSPIGDSHVVSGIWARLFTLFFLTLTLSTLALMLWYAISVECTAGSLFLPGLDIENSFVTSFLNQQNIVTCGSFGNFPNVTTGQSDYYCCSVNAGRVGTDGNCLAFESLSVCKNGDNSDQSDNCFNSGFATVQISYAQCTQISTAVVNSIQYATYAAELVCLVYLFIRVVRKHGCQGVFNSANWNDVIHNVSEVQKMKDVEIEMKTVKHVENPIRLSRAKPKPPPLPAVDV